MRKLLCLLFIAASGYGFSQISFNTGDSNFDAELNLFNKDAKSNLTGFKSDMSASFSISAPKIDDLLKIMSPAEVKLTLSIGQIANKPVQSVVDSYKANKSKGWGYIAKQMGIKPGSAEFHALKGKGNKGKGNPHKGNSGNGNSSKGKGKK